MKMDKEKLKIIDTIAIVVVCMALIGVIGFWLSNKIKTEDNFNTAPSSESDNSVFTWDAETASFIDFESDEALDKYFREGREKDLTEYNNATKGTIVEQVQNIVIPSYNDEKQLAQLQSGEIAIKAPASDDFPDGVLLWVASLEKDAHSFIVGDFNKDGLDDVAHIIGYSGGGSGYFYHLMIFVNDQGKLKYLTDEYIGDRIVIKDMQYKSGLFVVDMITQGKGEDFLGYCCPNVSATIKFRLENGRLVEV